MKLFCLPYAGGGASAFRPMQQWLPKNIQLRPLHLPGREVRFSEPLENNLASLIVDLAQQIIDATDEPYAIYGHSMGSVLAFELIRYLRRKQLRLPVHFFAAARGAPSLSGEYRRLSLLDDDQFLASVQAFGGLPDKLINNAEIRNLILPLLRSDFWLLDNYQYFEDEPLNLPITSLHGKRDMTVHLSWVQAWRYETTAEYQHHSIPGNHFFLNDSESGICTIIADTLNNYLRSAEKNESVALPL